MNKKENSREQDRWGRGGMQHHSKEIGSSQRNLQLYDLHPRWVGGSMGHSLPIKMYQVVTASDCKDVGQLHVVGGPAVAMPDRRIGVKAVVHHCVSKITLKRTINPRSGGSPKKAMNDYGRQSFLFLYIRSLHWSVQTICLPGKRQTRPLRTQTSYHKALRGGKELQSSTTLHGGAQ